MNSLKVMQWNFFSENDHQSGVKRYEDELFNNTNRIIDVKRVRRTRRNYLMDAFNFKTNNADIVHATFQMLAPLKIIKQPKKFVLTVHDIIPTIYFTAKQKIKTMWYLTEYAIPKADQIITDSEFTKNELIDNLGVDDYKINVVPLGVDDKYHPMNKDECKKRFNLNPNKKYILIVSSNEPWKNMELVNDIIDSIGDYAFIKIGYGQNSTNPRVINLGYINEIDIPYLYNACDIFLHTSLYEGFGLPVLEAMACGCPVISSNSASLPEVVKGAGILLDAEKVDSPKMFLDNIYHVLGNDDLRIRMVENGLTRSKEFSWNRTAKETIEVYNTLME
ncbi:glycosyltransferase family 4 protein [Candidatus Pacearchaeota archaeon]|nr:glycosyltransferase family 4 protein [Candidatus Pacearchaeota archaeon]